MQAGAQFGTSLLWVLLVATLAGLLIQILCVRLAVTTGKHLSQMCRNEYVPLPTLSLFRSKKLIDQEECERSGQMIENC